MAEGGGIGPRSNEGTAVYKTASAARQTPSESGKYTRPLLAASPEDSQQRPFEFKPFSLLSPSL
jgi:hypothetical protein